MIQQNRYIMTLMNILAHLLMVSRSKLRGILPIEIKAAGLGDESAAVLLGILCDAADQLSADSSGKRKEQWRHRGDIEFSQRKNYTGHS